MINLFLLDYNTRLRGWHRLRENLQETDLPTICVEVDKFWQKAPLLNHYLHPADIPDWPNPWELLSDNEYCLYARGLGIIYTLMLLGVKDVDFVEALDDNKENVVLVIVDDKFILNYWPNSVVDNKLSDFTNIKQIDIDILRKN